MYQVESVTKLPQRTRISVVKEKEKKKKKKKLQQQIAKSRKFSRKKLKIAKEKLKSWCQNSVNSCTPYSIPVHVSFETTLIQFKAL